MLYYLLLQLYSFNFITFCLYFSPSSLPAPLIPLSAPDRRKLSVINGTFVPSESSAVVAGTSVIVAILAAVVGLLGVVVVVVVVFGLQYTRWPPTTCNH